MAAPNLVSPTTMTLKTTFVALTTTSATTVLSNAVSSGSAYKISSLYVANVNGTTAADISIDVHNQDDGGGTGYAILSTVAVPNDGTVIAVDRNAPIYLEEDMSIVATAGTANYLEIVCCYEDVS